MRICIYSKPGSALMDAVAAGVTAAGHTAVWRNPAPFKRDCVERFDAVVVHGLNGVNRLIKECYDEAGVPIYVTDMGKIGRDRGYFYFGKDTWDHVTNDKKTTDRLSRMGYAVAESGGDNNGYTLVCHQPDATAEAWIAAQRLDGVVKHRRHPIAGELQESLEDALSGACCMVTYDSSAAYAAIIAGVPVVCSPTAVYASVAKASRDDREDFMARVAWSNWTLGELRAGLNWGIKAPEERQRQVHKGIELTGVVKVGQRSEPLSVAPVIKDAPCSELQQDEPPVTQPESPPPTPSPAKAPRRAGAKRSPKAAKAK